MGDVAPEDAQARVADEVVGEGQRPGDRAAGLVAEDRDQVPAVVAGVEVEEVVVDPQVVARALDRVAGGEVVVVDVEAVAAALDHLLAPVEAGHAHHAGEVVAGDLHPPVLLEGQLDREVGQDRVVGDPGVAELPALDPVEEAPPVGGLEAVVRDGGSLLVGEVEPAAGDPRGGDAAGVHEDVVAVLGVVGDEGADARPREVADLVAGHLEAVGGDAHDRSVQVRAAEGHVVDARIDRDVAAELDEVGRGVGLGEVHAVVDRPAQGRPPRRVRLQDGPPRARPAELDAPADLERSVEPVGAGRQPDDRAVRGGAR